MKSLLAPLLLRDQTPDVWPQQNHDVNCALRLWRPKFLSVCVCVCVQPLSAGYMTMSRTLSPRVLTFKMRGLG